MDNVDDLSQLGTVRSDFSSFLANNPHLESSMAQKYAQTQGDYEEYMRKQQRKQAKKDEKIRQKKEDQQRENEIQARVNEALKKQKKKDKTRRRTSTHSDLSVSSSDDDGPARVVNTPRPPATPMSPTPQHPAPVDPFAPMRQQSAPPPSGYYNSLRQPEVAQPVIDRERLIQAAQARMTNAQRQWRKATTDLMRLDLIIRQEAKIIIDNGGKPNMEEDLSAITATMNIGV